jgi:PEP-CTERM motif
MKRFVLTGLVSLAFSLTAFAGEVEVINGNGTLVGNASGLSLVSNLSYVSLAPSLRGAGIGSLSLTTGILSSGNLIDGGTFNFASSSFTISINPGIFVGLPQGGTLFSGAFTGPVTWSPISGEPGYYQILGTLAGRWWTGLYADMGYTSQTYFGTFNSSGVFTAKAGSGISFINPEPGTMGLLGTGLIGIAGMVRRKLKA